MRKQYWARRDPIKNYFPLPNEIFSLGLSSTAIAIYGYLLFRENRKTYECLASYRIIGEAIGKSVTTVRKYVAEQDKSVASYAASLVTSARSAGSLRRTGMGSNAERKPQIEVTQGLYPPVSRFCDDVFGRERRHFDG